MTGAKNLGTLVNFDGIQGENVVSLTGEPEPEFHTPQYPSPL